MRKSQAKQRAPIPEEALHAAAAEIERTRERLAASLGSLKHELDTLTHWRGWIARRPLPFFAGAFLLGLLVGSRHGRKAAR